MSFTHEIAEFFLRNNCLIFGGYVRDYLLNIPCADVDVKVRDKKHEGELLFMLLNKGYNIQQLDIKAGYVQDGCVGRFSHRRLLLTCYDSPVQVDLVYGNHIKPDCDVNRFTLEMAPGNFDFVEKVGMLKGDLRVTLFNLYKKEYVAEFGMSVGRHQKMRDKGFTRILDNNTRLPLPLPEDWKYNVNLSKIENIRVYRSVFGFDLKTCKDSCELALAQLSAEYVKQQENYGEDDYPKVEPVIQLG